MLKTMSALAELQGLDLAISAIEEQEKGINSDIERTTGELKAVEMGLEELAPGLEALEAKMTEYRGLIADCDSRVARDEQKINDVKNSRELSAINKEIRAAGKTKRQYEDELANVSTRADELKAQREELEASVAEKKDTIEKLTAELAEKRTGWSAEISEKAGRRELLASDIRPDVLRLYEMLRERRGGRGLVAVRNETCQGCFIHIPPQTYIELKKGSDELFTCPHCHRILYCEQESAEESAS